MNVRVTSQTQVNHAIADIRERTANAAKYSDQLSSGLRVTAASDDPAAFTAIAQARGFSRRADTYTRTISDATSDLDAGVAALQEGGGILSRAKQLAQTGTDSSLGPSDYEALATEVDTLVTRMVDAGNQKNDGRYLFGGTADAAPPFRVATTDAAGRPATVAYDGAAERAAGRVGSSQSVDTKYAGGAVFQQAGADAFAALIGLRDDLRDTTLSSTQKATAISARMADLDAAHTQLGEAMGEQSAALAGLEAIGSRLSDLKLSADARTGDLQGTDYAEAVVRSKEEETAFQATLSVTSRMFQTSLLDFIR